MLSALSKASSINVGSHGLRPSGVPGSFTSPARIGVWLPLQKIRRSERLLFPVPYCSILACVNGQSGREENKASAQDLTSAQKATSFSRTSCNLLMQLGENFVFAARHGEILQKISGAAIQITKKT